MNVNNKMVAINEAEAIFYPAFDKYLCDDNQMQFNNCTMERLWDTLSFNGGREFSIQFSGKVDLYGYDKILCFITVPVQVIVEGRALIDGKETIIFQSTKGDTAPIELISPILKKVDCHSVLEKIELKFSSSGNKNVVLLSWFGASTSTKEYLIEESLPKKDSQWKGLLNSNTVGKINNNLVFSEAEVIELKKYILADESLKNKIIRNAEKSMHIEPEKAIREFVPVSNHMYRFVRVRDRGRENFEEHILNLAIGGYVLEEAKYSNLAARMILSLLYMKWFEGPTCCMEGSTFHHVCFTEDHLSSQVCIAMGFLGDVFTEKGIEKIVNKVEDAWKWVTKKCEEQGYRSFMNQGIVGNRGAILGACFLQLYRSGYEKYVEESYQRLNQIVENYLSKDGHCAEGIHYFEYSFTAAIMLWHVYAKMTGKALKEIVPQSFKNSGAYLEAVFSTTSTRGVKIPLNCGLGKEISTLLLIFMIMECDFEVGKTYLKERLLILEEHSDTTSFDTLFYELYKNKLAMDSLIEEKTSSKEILLYEEGLAAYQFEEGKLVVSAERNPYTAHFHEDRGQIVLEVGKQILLPDLGTTSYANPVCILMEKKEYHNLACPMDLAMQVASKVGIMAARNAAYNLDQTLTKEDMRIPEAKILYTKETQDGYQFSVETGMLYGPNIKGIRTGTLKPKEAILRLQDEWCFEEIHPLLITYLSYDPWLIKENIATTKLFNINFVSKEKMMFEVEENMVDWNEKPVFVLHVVVESAKCHEVISTIQWNAGC